MAAEELNPILQDGESTHSYNGRKFVVDFYMNTWQCTDSGMIVKGRGKTKEEAIEEAHKAWDNYILAQEGGKK